MRQAHGAAAAFPAGRRSFAALATSASLLLGASAAPTSCQTLSRNPDLNSLTGSLVSAAVYDDSRAANDAEQVVYDLDGKHDVATAGSPHAVRLQRLFGPHHSEQGLHLNYRVYLTPSVNAFAAADGSVRVYSGLMNLTSDDELLCVIGHEIGHVLHGHSKEQLRLAVLSQAGRDYLGTLNNDVGTLSRGDVGAVGNALLNSRFSQAQESEADEFGLAFMTRYGYDEWACVSIMRKLAQLGSRGGGLFDTHPDPDRRADVLAQQIRSRPAVSAPGPQRAPGQ